MKLSILALALLFPASARAVDAPSPAQTETILGQKLEIAPMPNPNGWDALLEAIRALTPLSGPPSEPPTNDAARDLALQRDSVGRNAMALVRLRQALQLPSRVPPARSSAEMMSQPRGQLRELARLLAQEAIVLEDDGDFAGAADSCLDAMLMAHTTSRGGTFLQLLSGSGQEQVGQNALWALLPRLNAESARDALRRLQAIDARRPLLSETLQAERRELLRMLSELLRETKWDDINANERRKALQNLDESAQPSRELLELNSHGLAARVFRLHDEALARADEPFQFVPEPPKVDVIEAVFAPNLPAMQLANARTRARSALLQTVLALRAFHAERNTLPDTLSQLTPDYLKIVPRDPFAPTQELRYKRDGQSFSLYSIGPNGQDDAGVAAPRAENGGDLISPVTTFAAR